MNDSVGARWRARLSEGLDAMAAWAQEKGAWRWVSFGLGVILVALWALGLWGMPASGRGNFGAGFAAGYGLLSFAALVAGAILISPMLVPLAARPFCWFIDSIYLGGSAIERPPLSYVVAERRMQEGRYEEAAAEFERLAYWHPRVVRVYVDGIRAARLAGNERTANRLFRRGRLRCPAALEALRTSLETQCAVLSDRPWQSQTGV
jgi:hypothetical protein